MLELKRVAVEEVDWDELDAFPDRVVYQTREWLSFLTATQGAEPIVAAVQRDGETVGWFTGMLVRRYGLRILGSPFPRWLTQYMGFNLRDGVSRTEAAEALLAFALGPLGCNYVELRDRLIAPGDLPDLDSYRNRTLTYLVDLSRDEEAVFKSFDGSTRTSVRRAEKAGVVIEEASDLEFADDYFAQLQDVFAKQGLTPTHDVERVREMFRHVHPSGHLLLLRARNAEGTCIASGIFPGMNEAAYFLGGASWREYQHLRPNEALVWHAMRTWKARGITSFDLGGGGKYKLKYRPEELIVPMLRRSRPAAIVRARVLAERTMWMGRRLQKRVHRARASS